MLPLDNLGGVQLGLGYKLQVEIELRKYIEQRNFQLYIIGEDGWRSVSPIVTGIYSAGRKSIGIKGWMDIEYFENVDFKCRRMVNLTAFKLDIPLFRILGRLIPAGGSIMVAYQMFWRRSNVHTETEQLLQHGTPSELTPLGFLMFHAGCLSFKDWYWPEGGREGPQKLQGFKPLNRRQAAIKIRHIIYRLEDFLTEKTVDTEIFVYARKRAGIIIALLRKKIKVDHVTYKYTRNKPNYNE